MRTTWRACLIRVSSRRKKLTGFAIFDYTGQASRADTDRLAAQRLGAVDRQRGVVETMCGGPVPDVCAK